MHSDARGLALSTPNADAAQHLFAAVDSTLNYGLDTGDHVKAALAADPDCVMAHVFRGHLMLAFYNAALLPSAGRSLAAAQALRERANDRERLHIDVLAALVAGNHGDANRAYEALLSRYPLDLLALRQCHGHYFWQGDHQNLRDCVLRVLPQWGEDTPGYGYLKGMLSFGQEECGDYSAAERNGREAVERNPEDHWATHAVAHVLEMQGRHRDGLTWLSAHQASWAGRNYFIHHLWWHKALYHLELEQFREVMRLYDEEIRKEPTDFYLDLQNAVSLLWRLELLGKDVGSRWQELADQAQQHIQDQALPFNDVHYVMALLRAGREDAARQLVESLRNATFQGAHGNAAVIGEVTLPVCEALLDWHRGDYTGAAARLTPAMPRLHRMGASHAQRDVIAQTLVEATLRGGLVEQALTLLTERTRMRPSSAASWRKLAMALESSRNPTGADTARARAESLVRAER